MNSVMRAVTYERQFFLSVRTSRAVALGVAAERTRSRPSIVGVPAAWANTCTDGLERSSIFSCRASSRVAPRGSGGEVVFRDILCVFVFQDEVTKEIPHEHGSDCRSCGRDVQA